MINTRKHVRIRNYDYSSPDTYFVTICTADRIPFFGEINDGIMQLSHIGEVANQYWLDIPDHFKYAKLDEYIIMPDHIHGIIHLSKKENWQLRENQFSKPSGFSFNNHQSIQIVFETVLQ